MDFQRGDIHITLAGQSYGLRLTMGALAEISSRLSVRGPQDLSLRLRNLSPADGRVLLACVMRPCLSPLAGSAALAEPAANFSRQDIVRALPAICQLFEQAFARE